MKINLNSDKELDFYIMLFKVINLIYSSKLLGDPMAEAEIKVLAYFCTLDFEKFRYQLFSTLARRKVLQMIQDDGWNLSKTNLNNRLYSLLEKKILLRDEDRIIHLDKNLMNAIEQVKKTGSIDIIYQLKLDNGLK